MEKIIIGDATLFHGDCLEILPTLEKVDAVVTDPPYGIDLKPQRGITDPIQNDSIELAKNLWVKFTPMLANLSKDGTSHLFWYGWSSTWTKDILEKHYSVKNCIVWGKNVWGLGYHIRPQHEMAWYSHYGKPQIPETPDSNLWLIDRVHAPNHSCEKPVLLSERSVQLCDQNKGIILDPFMGTGTTGIASMNLGRKFIGIEIEKKYFDIACERIEQAQKQGRLFD